ncbi:unnamed protein product, partial [Choristocarpus tenellus]
GTSNNALGEALGGTQVGFEARTASTNVLREEVAKFSHLDKNWWNPKSKQGTGPLHSMNVTRVQHIARQVGHHMPKASPHVGTSKPLLGLRVLDVGCGGGLLSESLARLGATVTGVDPSPENVAVASAHSRVDPLTRDIVYRAVQAEDLVSEGEKFDLVATLEVIEHVADQDAFLSSLSSLTGPGGMLVLSTISKTFKKSFALVVVGAEYVTGLVPVGTHDWGKFLHSMDLKSLLQDRGFNKFEATGLIYNPLLDCWREDKEDLDVNYIITAMHQCGLGET